jgi:methionyl-tRNA formyltransferase
MQKHLNLHFDGICNERMDRMKIAFTTCVQLGESCIKKILDMGGNLDLLITLKDEKAKNKSGRIYLDNIAKENNIPLLKINNINDSEAVNEIKEKDIDWLFIIGWSQIARCEVLNAPKKGCIGMHPTLLPKGRGRASVPWAILKGLDKTGVTMFRLDEGVDTGDILGQIEIPLHNKITATELYEKVNQTHIELIEKYWDDIVNDNLTLKKQDDTLATIWEGRKPEDGELNGNMTIDEAERLVRAVTHPYPGAFYYEKEKKVTVWSAEVSDHPQENNLKLKDGYLNFLEYEIESCVKDEESISN